MRLGRTALAAPGLNSGLHRAQTAEQRRKRREYLDTFFTAIPVELFTREMGQLAAKIDAESRKFRRTILFADPIGVTPSTSTIGHVTALLQLPVGCGIVYLCLKATASVVRIDKLKQVLAKSAETNLKSSARDC